MTLILHGSLCLLLRTISQEQVKLSCPVIRFLVSLIVLGDLQIPSRLGIVEFEVYSSSQSHALGIPLFCAFKAFYNFVHKSAIVTIKCHEELTVHSLDEWIGSYRFF